MCPSIEVEKTKTGTAAVVAVGFSFSETIRPKKKNILQGRFANRPALYRLGEVGAE